MATNNYYGFTHGGTQYGNQYTGGAPGFPAAQQPYAQPSAPGQPQQGYGTAAPGADAYVLQGYTRPAGQQGQVPQQQQGYYTQQQSTSGYPLPMSAPGTAKLQQQQGARPAVTSTMYPSYSANTAGTTTSSTYAGFAPPQAQTSNSAGAKSSFTNYDCAVYNAVSAYAQGSVGQRGAGMGFKKGPKGVKSARPMPKPQTLHYCDVCKISCAGPQTYKEHLDGQKHKKKEAAQKVGTVLVPKGGPAGLRCELCDVTCTGSDAYAAHIRGAKHQKVLKLHTKLGKPIPSDNPTVVATPPSLLPSSSSNSSGMGASSKTFNNSGAGTSSSMNQFSKASTPKINFIGNKPEASTQEVISPLMSQSQLKPMSTTYSTPAAPGGNSIVLANTPAAPAEKVTPEYIEKDVQPVGQDYIEEMRNEEGKIVSFNCKLCECRFNDPNAKEMHMKGRRHRLQYKKKVNPDLVVDVKPSSRQKKLDDRRSARPVPLRKMQNSSDQYGRGPPMPLIPPGGPRGFGPGFGAPGPNPMFFIPPLIRRPETMEDRHVMAKHAEIYPKEEELQAIQKIVSNTEKALKFVSDRFAEEDCNKVNGVKVEGVESVQASEADLQSSRILKGVMRVGHLAKGLLLKGDRSVELVVLCSEKPTVTMLERIFDALPKQFEVVAAEEKYDVTKKIQDSGILISSTIEPKIEVKITLTSPVMRASGADAPGEAQATTVTDPHDVLDKEKCLDALAALRHAKFFQARATALQSCVIVIRILRDMCQRLSSWRSLSCWAVELLTEKAINIAGMPVSPGDALRLVLEVVASGVLLPQGPGLLDPCEKESCDAIAGLSNQAREDITAAAQLALRELAFRHVHKVLGMEPLPRYNKKSAYINRKRRRDHSGTGEGDDADAGNDGKKDKKEELTDMDKVEIKSEVVG